jgi:hypothetical protein
MPALLVGIIIFVILYFMMKTVLQIADQSILKPKYPRGITVERSPD